MMGCISTNLRQTENMSNMYEGLNMLTKSQSDKLCKKIIDDLDDKNLSGPAQKMLLYVLKIIKGAATPCSEPPQPCLRTLKPT